MREIKFSYISQQEEAGYFRENIFTFLDVFDGTVKKFYEQNHRLIVVAVRQYTGLKDRSGKEIYEGDIIQQYLSDYEDDNTLYTGIVEYISTEFCLRTNCDTLIKIIQTGHNLEVVGNIYQNPELLTNTN